MKEFMKDFYIVLGIIALLFVGLLIHATIRYNSEPDHKVYVEWVVYGNSCSRTYSNTYDMKGGKFGVRDYWKSTGKYGGSHHIVEIYSKDACHTFWPNEVVCIYAGMNDVDVKTVKIVE